MGHFVMQVLMPETIEPCAVQVAASTVLGTSLVLDLESFPELSWLPAYLEALTTLQSERDRLTSEIQAIAQSGDVYRHQWIEPYFKTKGGKQYTYYQLRWLTGERKPSDQPKVKTKHLSRRAVGHAQAAIARGQQVEAFEQQRRHIEAEIARLQQLVGVMGNRLKQKIVQHTPHTFDL
jgi:hypothetical protein